MSSGHDVHVVEGTNHVIPHHFSSAFHEFDASKFGMWLFLVTEILLFGGLFVAFIIYQGVYPALFKEAHHELNRVMGALNTVFLLTSSLTMALGVGYAQRSERSKANLCMLITLGFAAGFMVVKYFEYTHKFHLGIYPGKYYTYEGIKEANASLFFSLYFLMTGLHGLHVLIGMILIGWVMYRNSRGDFNKNYFTPVELVGLYWHLVDLIWIFLFPLLYLIT